jgi:hypothetical protein
MTTRPPIRVERKGWRKYFHPTAKELEDAVLWAEAEARHWRWENINHLMDWFGSQVRMQIMSDVGVEIVATQIETEDAKIAIWTRTIGPAYAHIGQSNIGKKPIDALDAGFQAVQSAVARVAEEVKAGAKEIAAHPTAKTTLEPLVLTERVSEPAGQPLKSYGPAKQVRPPAPTPRPAAAKPAPPGVRPAPTKRP